MKRLVGIIASVGLLLTIGVGSAAAAPNNKNTISWPVTCDGQSYTVTYNSGSAVFRSDGADLILMGAMRDGAWVVPLVPGQADKDLTVCSYTFFGHDDVIWVKVVTA